MYSTPAITMLPDPLVCADGKNVASPVEWPTRRAELLESIQQLQYGHLPPAPDTVAGYLLHDSHLTNSNGVIASHYRLMTEPGGFTFLLTLVLPPGDGPYPLVIDGDDCWRDVTNDILLTATRRGYAVALFNRVEIVPDNMRCERDTGLYTVYPDGDFGALAAWAWAYHRVIDFVQQLPAIDAARIAVTGHSRGGKAALLAGATDERIALTVPNNSGCGGAGCTRFPDDGAERITDILRNFSYWFSPRLRDFIGRENELPFDQHSVKALVAPRALLSTEALGDYWASPHGTRLTHDAACEVYRYLGAEHRIGIVYRAGGHAQTLQDWEVLFDFADLQFYNKPCGRDFDMKP